MSKRHTHNGTESKIIRTMDDLKLYDALIPSIRAAALAGGGADAILKRSEAIAALQLVESLSSEKDDVKLKASIEILNRTGGKPVERTLNIYGDISRMSEKDIDNQILKAIERTGADQLIEAVVHERKVLPNGKVKQSRKPKKIQLDGQVDPTAKP